MMVPLPPIRVAKPMGISVAEAGALVCAARLIRIGSSMTTMGVLFMNALSTAVTSRIRSSAKAGILVHNRPSWLTTGSSAPVFSSALPTIISAHMVTSAS